MLCTTKNLKIAKEFTKSLPLKIWNVYTIRIAGGIPGINKSPNKFLRNYRDNSWRNHQKMFEEMLKKLWKSFFWNYLPIESIKKKTSCTVWNLTFLQINDFVLHMIVLFQTTIHNKCWFEHESQLIWWSVFNWI